MRFADYENDIRVLQAKLRQTEKRNAELEQRATADAALRPSTPVEKPPPVSRFGSFMGARRAAPVRSPGRENELEAALVREQAARIAAEKKVKEVSAEIEELSVTLFQQANEMVAAERRENAALKRTLDDLEKTTDGEAEARHAEIRRLKQKIMLLEERETDRRKRLERIEAAQMRLDRVRDMLLPR